MKVKQILMKRDGISAEEADDIIAAFKEELNELLGSEECSIMDAEDLVEMHFGLEPDYLDEFLFGMM